MKYNEKQFYGILNSKDANRYKYFIKHCANKKNVWICEATESIKRKIETEGELYIVWTDEVFCKHFFEKCNDERYNNVRNYRILEFYRKVLTGIISQNGYILVMPNDKDEGMVISAKELKIDIFKKVWEGEQDEWIFQFQ